MTAVVETLTDTFPKLIQYRLCICFSVCGACLTVNIALVNNNFLEIFLNWSQNGMTYTLLLLIPAYLIGLYVYSLKNIANDFHFTYGSPLRSFWIQSVKASTLVIIICLLLMIFQKFEFIKTRTDTYLLSIMYGMMGAILGPIPGYMIYIFTMYQRKRKNIFLIHPSPSWGPPKTMQKYARKKFNPDREMHHKSEILHCKHNCLVNSAKIKDEIERLNENRQKMIEVIGEEALMHLQDM